MTPMEILLNELNRESIPIKQMIDYINSYLEKDVKLSSFKTSSRISTVINFYTIGEHENNVKEIEDSKLARNYIKYYYLSLGWSSVYLWENDGNLYPKNKVTWFDKFFETTREYHDDGFYLHLEFYQ